MCISHARRRLAREQHRPLLSCIITGDEKWCLYANIRKSKERLSLNKKETPRKKTWAHPQTIMLCIWWNNEGVLYFELLPRGVAITADIYCQQLRRLADAIQENDQQDCVKWCYHDIARLQSANLTKALQELGWDVIPHPPYSPDFALYDFTFSALYWTSIKELPFRMKMYSEHGLTTSSTQNHAISRGAEWKNYSSVGRLL